MKIKVIFLVFVLGAIAVLAEEESSEEKPNSEQRLLSEEEPSGEQMEDVKENEKKNEGSKLVGLGKALKALNNTDRRIQKLTTRGDGNFHWMLEAAVERESKFKKRVHEKLRTLEFTLKAQKENEMRKAMNDGKDVAEIQKCLGEQNFDLKNEMKNDLESAVDCFKDATKEARKTLGDLRNRFLDVTKQRIEEINKRAKDLKSCVDEKNSPCILEKTADLRHYFNKTFDLAGFYIKNGEKALEEQKKKMVDCRKDFLENMNQVGDGFITLMRQCINA